jgi:hypothetical protein
MGKEINCYNFLKIFFYNSSLEEYYDNSKNDNNEGRH